MSTLIDFASSDVVTIIDFNPGATLIPDTSEPGAPQFTYTIQSGDLPPNASGHAADFMAVLTIGGRNNDAVAQSINVRATLNGSNVATAASASLPTGQPFWPVAAAFGAGALQAGDVIGFKMWGSAANQIDYRYATLYIVTRDYGVPAADQIARIAQTTNLTGAVPGVSYTPGYSVNPSIIDGASAVGFSQGNIALDGCTLRAGNLQNRISSISPQSAASLLALQSAGYKIRVMDV